MTTERVFCTEPHAYGPGPMHWAVWAADMARTHEQYECPDCHLWVIWRPRTAVPAAEPEQLGFDTEAAE
ncbi:hypothetical protein [Pseudonocardia sp. 73-21]|uniref:hypothetical protein n=1 Tax=Pseudonocardia sp. 73-21 TaxID=1895809 RepID=UPI00095BB27A|nr:hypothetical protein [Pseudonocardia sp. 73-21]OJY47614.1 MAG: hypothetical protein BGP03_33315 [Pseudonocardia sp. 73-21]